jgi:erythrin-vacuolar iron transport family protein
VAFGVVGLELLAISFIRYRYVDMSFLMSALQVVLGGALVFASGILIGSA